MQSSNTIKSLDDLLAWLEEQKQVHARAGFNGIGTEGGKLTKEQQASCSAVAYAIANVIQKVHELKSAQVQSP